MQLSEQIIRQLQFQWMASKGIKFDDGCSLIHVCSCPAQFVTKLRTVYIIGAKYYLVFHLIPLFLRLKKSKDGKTMIAMLFKSIKQYIKSVLFMTFLVGGVKSSLCMSNYAKITQNGYMFGASTFLASFSIFFEQASRRKQIGYFVLAKALGSIYVGFKRMNWIHTSQQGIFLHITCMAMIYYIFNHQQNMLKFRNIFAMLWGDDQNTS